MRSNNQALTLLLNKAQKIIRSGKGTTTELAKFLGKPFPRAHEWVIQRSKIPGGGVTLQIQEWVELKTRKTSK